jgi:CRISPR-associated endonuclease/helicase Cas3
MNILLVSQCEKRALTQTRRILDQFAERMGDRTWQTPITQAGLDTLRKLLRQTARKNTAVACHWIRGKDHSELVWIVGDASRFNQKGSVPTNSTLREVLKEKDEHNWHNGEAIQCFTALAALLHDIGKASKSFQDKLNGKNNEANQYRHEWVSLRLFQAFVGKLQVDANSNHEKMENDLQWLQRLADCESVVDKQWEAQWLDGLIRDDGLNAEAKRDRPLMQLAAAPIAQVIGWLIVSHHRLPQLKNQRDDGTFKQGGEFGLPQLKQWPRLFDAQWNGANPTSDLKSIKPYWTFPKGLPLTHPEWRKQASKLAKRLIKISETKGSNKGWFEDPFVMHISRLSLMLSDHYYSSLSLDVQTGKVHSERIDLVNHFELYANTSSGSLNQHLDEHLIGVAQHSKSVTWALPRFDKELPKLGRHKLLRKRAEKPQFQWQNKAYEAAESMRERSLEKGAFVVNMASTGCGKTLANAKIMYALSHPDLGMRCAFAMGLRTLTLQTGKAFQQLLNLGDEELAIRVGDSATRELFNRSEKEAETTGSASTQSLLDESSHVLFEGNIEDHPLLSKVMHDPNVRALLLAPMLVCTIDHLMPATEADRGGRQIAPMLRLLSSDLVLDEPDDFDLSDLPALTRLVNWAGLLGSRVLLSSATLPPALILGLFQAYQEGRKYFVANRSRVNLKTSASPDVCCLWVDEFGTNQHDCSTPDEYLSKLALFTASRCSALSKQAPKRKYELIPFAPSSKEDAAQEFAAQSILAAIKLHQSHYSLDVKTRKRVSFGLIRMANIRPLFDVGKALYKTQMPEDICIHLCTYHSQYPMILRSLIESQLDNVLNRREPNSVFENTSIRQVLDSRQETNHLFIVLGSPVTEVGRDHDYDWAVVEPSSMRSLIQLAGRIRRHRDGECTTPNMLVFNTNLKHIRDVSGPAFMRPGFEDHAHQFDSHELLELLKEQPEGVLDARARITSKPANELMPKIRMVDLEHSRIQSVMLKNEGTTPSINAATWWQVSAAHTSALLIKRYPFRKTDVARKDCYLKLNDEEDTYVLTELLPNHSQLRSAPVEISHGALMHKQLRDDEFQNSQVLPWCHTDYLSAIADLADLRGTSLSETAKRFGSLSLPASEQGWISHPHLGFRQS